MGNKIGKWPILYDLDYFRRLSNQNDLKISEEVAKGKVDT